MGRRKHNMDDVIDAIQDALHMAESIASEEQSDDSKEVAITAINAIRRGDYTGAITTLEREFLPKWANVEECRAAYAMNGDDMGELRRAFAKALVMQGAV